MRCLGPAILAVVFTAGAFAQGWGQRSVPRTSSGWGNVAFPGTGGPPPMVNPFGFTFGQRLMSTVNGGYRGFPARGHQQGGVIAVPYPIVVGGFDNPYGYGYQQQPNVTLVMPPQAAQPSAPPVIINQYFTADTAKPAMQEYAPDASGLRTYQAPTNPVAEPNQGDQVMFYIALTDNSVYTAVAYWVDGETLHYITPQGKHNQVSLALVDRDLSARLNQGHKVEFHLPAR